MSYFQAFIFDMDGTITSTAEDIVSSVNFSLKIHGLDTISLKEGISYLGNGSVKLIQRAMHFKNQEIFQDVFDDYYSNYLNNFMVKSKPYDHIVESLIYAKEKGILLFIYTNKPEKIALEIVNNLYPKNLFNEMVGIPLGGKTKPDPLVFINACKKYKLDYSKIAYFGDSTTDIETAHNLNVGLMCSVLWGYQDKNTLSSFKYKPDKYLSSPLEIKNIVDM